MEGIEYIWSEISQKERDLCAAVKDIHLKNIQNDVK